MAEDQVHPHPLLIELVLENVFKNLSKPSLLTCRQVCSKWYHESSKYFRPLGASACVDTPNSLYQLISTYLSCIEGSRPSFHLAVDWAALGDYDRQLLFEVLGSNIMSVSIAPTDLTNLSRILYTLLHQIPHLKELAFEELQQEMIRSWYLVPVAVSILPSAEHRDQFQSLTSLKMNTRIENCELLRTEGIFWQLFHLVPSLKSFEVTIMEFSLRSHLLTGFEQALTGHKKICQNLKSLKLGTTNNSVLEAIVDVGMHLEELSLVSIFQPVSSETLERVLRNQAPYLRCLALGGASARNERRIELTGLGPPFQLPNLTELKLLGELVINDNFADQLQVVHWQGLNWRLQMPKLEKLELVELRLVCFELVFGCGSDEISENVRTLILKAKEEVPGADQLRRLAKAFPGLTELEVVADSLESIVLVFQSWPMLKRLKLSIVGDIDKIDEAFTGIVFKEAVEFEEVTDVAPSSEVFEDAGVFEGGGASTGGGLTNLKELEYLNVEFRKAVVFGQGSRRWPFTKGPAYDGHLLSDVTGTLALLMMRKLNAVFINKSNLTRDFVNLLRTELSLETCAIKDRFGEIISPKCLLD